MPMVKIKASAVNLITEHLVKQYGFSNSVIISIKERMTPIALLVFHLIHASGKAKGFRH